MARYTGPKSKIARKFGEPIFGADKVLDKKNYPSGQHGLARKRKKVSEYGIQLKEKQKAKAIYGILEKQFRRTFEEAARRQGITGENLLILLESRLDNTVYRLGIAPTRAAARQLVSHRHITVNGDVLNIPSYMVKVGDVIAVREKSKSMEVITNSIGTINTSRYSWLEWNQEILGGKMLQRPDRTEIPESINEQLIVELYSK
ncbi:MAG: 30S ribosomal protein S4 [Rikenellaceae bacterium]